MARDRCVYIGIGLILMLSCPIAMAEPDLRLAQASSPAEQEALRRLAEYKQRQQSTVASAVLEKEVAALKKELTQVSNELDALQQSHTEVLKSRSQLLEQVGSLKQQVSEKEDLLSSSNQSSANIDSQMLEENTEFRNLVKTLEGQKAGLESELRELNKQNEKASKEIESLEKYRRGYKILKKRFSESGDLQDSVDRLVTSNKRLQLDLKKAKMDLIEAKRKLDDTEARVDQLGVLVRRKKSEYAALEKLHEQLASSNEGKKEQISRLEDQVRTLRRGSSVAQNSCEVEAAQITSMRKQLSGQEAVYEELRETISTQIHRVADLEEKLAEAEKAKTAASRKAANKQCPAVPAKALANGEVAVAKEKLKALRDNVIELEELRAEKAQLEKRLEKAEKSASLRKSDYGNVISEMEKQKGQILSFEDQVASQKAKIASLEKQLSEQKNSNELVAKLSNQVNDLQKQYIEANNLVMLKDTELRMLRSRSTSARPQRIATPKPRTTTRRRTERRTNQRGTPVSYATPVPTQIPTRVAPPAPTEMLTIRVIADKVNLRVRPGKEHSPLQQVARGTELVVESRVGDWYQVITPTGSRAYILSDFVQEIRGISGSPSRRSQLPMRTMPQTMPQDIPGMAPFGATPGSAPSSGATADEKQAEEEAEAMRLLKDAMSGR